MGNPVMQFQILAKNPDQQVEFYGKLFGWRTNADNALGYRMIETDAGAGINGGIWPAPPEGRPMVALFIAVDDLADTVEKASALGATVILPPQKLPDGDEMAYISDPEGIPVGLFKSAK